LNTFVSGRDRVELDGRPLEKQRLAYVLLRKPAGVVTTASDPQGRPTVVDLVADHETRVVPVGRLDADTTGALLLTNDGPLAHRLAHPRYEVEKVYEAEVEGDPDEDALRRLRDGVELEDGRTAPACARRLGRARVELALHEGRKHQVKRMLEAVGHPVVRLHRSRYADLTVAGLGPGESRELTGPEVESLRGLVFKPASTCFAAKTVERSFTAASRVLSGARSYRRSIVARIDVVSYCVWSTTKFPRRNGETTSVGMRVPGPQRSCGPGVPPWPGGGT